jgi:hypothetical protein
MESSKTGGHYSHLVNRRWWHEVGISTSLKDKQPRSDYFVVGWGSPSNQKIGGDQDTLPSLRGPRVNACPMLGNRPKSKQTTRW